MHSKALAMVIGTVAAISLVAASGSSAVGHSQPPKTYDSPPVVTPGVANLPLARSGPSVRGTVTASVVTQTLIDQVNGKTLKVKGWGYNGGTPGPTIVVKQGDRVELTLRNDLPEATSIHWHGLTIPNSQDGVPDVEPTPLVKPGESYTYRFTIVDPPGTHIYHSHVNTTKQDNLGLVGAFTIQPRNGEDHRLDRDYVQILQSWAIPQARSMEAAGLAEQGPDQGVSTFDPVSNVTAGTFPENPESGMFNFQTINGKAYPSTDPLVVSKGERVRIRFVNISQFNHPMHMHGQYFQQTAQDGAALPAPITANTVLAVSGGTQDIEFTASNPGRWPLHCHLPHHVTNNGSTGEGGMFTVVEYTGSEVKPG
ncbi:MAG: multicopper oxidase domain-containing protein [Actinomycetota bacterium]